MEKVINFIQFEQKNTHISLCIIVHLCTIATVTVHICMVTVPCVFIILLISVRTFFSLSSPCTTNLVTFLFSSSFSLDAHNHNHTHTQTHPHRQINTQTHPHTNKPTQINQRRDRPVLDWNELDFLWFTRRSRLVDRRVV